MNKYAWLFFLIFISPAVAETVSDFSNMCAATGYKRLYAIFPKNEYTCPSGYFLPANSTECASCPNGYTCAGGTFPVNTTTAQGLVRNSDYIVNGLGKACALNQAHALNAVFTINSYDCAPGYYLVADAEECTICPAGSYCVGGRYTFNETTTQGIEPCPDGTISMAGAPACYPHILHIGDDIVYLKSEKLTTPSLNIGMNGEVFYANMTTTPTLMNKDSEHYLKLEYDNTVYYVCDDTMYAQ